MAVNCSAIPESLFESELFGHKKGSFTGAIRDHSGLFREADGGTLFLDEIGDMPKSIQVKLLRVLQEMKVRPVGGTKDEPVDVRIISATHANLENAMREGIFREDLYYRLNVVTFLLPALAQRPEDIPLLANYFLRTLAEIYGDKVKGFSPEAMECLVNFEWPGNVRQLLNVVRNVVVLSPGGTVTAAMLPAQLRSAVPLKMISDNARADPSQPILPLWQVEKAAIERAIDKAEGNIVAAAHMLGIDASTIYRKRKEWSKLT